MRVVVVAAGGIGGYYGGLLAKAGHEIVFIARGQHLTAIRENGLAVKSIDNEFQVKPARATDAPAQLGPMDLILFSVKTYDTEAAARQIRPLVRNDTVIVTFQNGIESADQIGAEVGRDHVVTAPTQIVTFIAGPGKIEQKSNFRVVSLAGADVQRWPQLAQMAEVFRANGVDVQTVGDMRKAVWLKFLRLSTLSGLTTLARTEAASLFQDADARECLEAAMREIMAVGITEGIGLEAADLKNAMDWAVNMKPGIKASMHNDIEHGKRLEIDALSGAVVRLGKKHGIPTPVHQTILAGLKPIDERNRLLQDHQEAH